MFRIIVPIAVLGVVVSLVAPKSARIILLLSTLGISVGLIAFFVLGFRNFGRAQEKDHFTELVP